MMFKIINLTNGSHKDCSFEELSTSLSVDCEIMLNKEDSFEAIGFVSHKTLVFFSVEFAHYALQNYTKKNIPEAQACIDFTRKWIEDSNSVSTEQLRAAADAAYAAYAAAYAAYAAYAAADAADAAYANAAAYVAYAAADAAYAANNKQKEKSRQGNFILKHYGIL